MTVKKEAVAGVASFAAGTPAAKELEEINRFTKTPLEEGQVYLFHVRLCDNQVDRDNEYFSRDTLEQLAPLFVGKTGIFDHDWSAKNQRARIYRAEVVNEPGVVPETEEAACFLKGCAYMLRNEENQSIIEGIEGGILKEVSVSCAVSHSVCSICGENILDRTKCSHVKGATYDGKRCVVALRDPVDAFEWSFVAVPAQKKAGVMKAKKADFEALEEVLGKGLDGASMAEKVRQLEKEAHLGRRYLDGLRAEVVRLGLLAQEGMERETLAAIASKLEEPELFQMKEAYEGSLSKRMPLCTQLSYDRQEQGENTEDKAFCI